MGLFKMGKKKRESNAAGDVDQWLKSLETDADRTDQTDIPIADTFPVDQAEMPENPHETPNPPLQEGRRESDQPTSSTEEAPSDLWHLPNMKAEPGLDNTTKEQLVDSGPPHGQDQEALVPTIDPALTGFVVDAPDAAASVSSEPTTSTDTPLWGLSSSAPASTELAGGTATMPTQNLAFDDQTIDPNQTAAGTEPINAFMEAHTPDALQVPQGAAHPFDPSELGDNSTVFDSGDFRDHPDLGVVIDPPAAGEPTNDQVQMDDPPSIKHDSDGVETSISVPSGEQAATLLAILGLGRDASWNEVRDAHRSLISDHQASGESDPERAELARSIRREINAAYVALRLLQVP